MREIWVEKEAHTIPMVCWGTKKDHIVYSPDQAKRVGEELISASIKALEEFKARQEKEEDDAGQG